MQIPASNVYELNLERFTRTGLNFGTDDWSDLIMNTTPPSKMRRENYDVFMRYKGLFE